ncbi:MAG: 16S rRNA (cytosine(1402)-N(4))-methyltransferase RsmH [Candidatus Omnitrophica bacterium]|nr:16S rRNA (cytosine(1402)-N(4))-methyltransferase RsmH [Candidatus Omnitrophota bacterium]
MDHVPVLVKEVIHNLDPAPGDIVLDATVGGGGHSEEILRRILPGGRLIAVDRDGEALERARRRLKGFSPSVTYVNGDFRNIDGIFDSLGIDGIDRALFDLGMSSFQVDDERRGFSFSGRGPLDMRFDLRQQLSAAEIVNKFSQALLADIIKSFGEERYAALVAKKICAARKKKRIETTSELRAIIIDAIGRKYRGQRLHPAARTFQALRIYTNDELAAAGEGVSKAVDHLRPKGRICVISFHSLEDRIVKNIFRDMAKGRGLGILTRKPITPGMEEIRNNPRARSAKLRVSEKL